MTPETLTTKKTYKTYQGSLTEEEYLLINDTFNDVLFEHLLTTGEAVTLPKNMGKLQITKFKPTKKKAIDFHATKIYGKTIYHDNVETDGYAAKLHWYKKKYRFKNKHFWSVKFTRHRIRYDDFSLVKYIKQNGVYHLTEL
jgi:hypothetical protein